MPVAVSAEPVRATRITGGAPATRAAWAAAAVAVVVATAANIWVAWGSTIPVFYTDEVGYVANAQLLSGIGAPRDFSASSYYLGWSVLLVPFWWILQDPEHVYRAAVAGSVACGVLVIWPLAALGRRLGMAMPWAIVAAAAVSVAPGHLVMSNFGLAENFITLLVATAAILAVRFAESPSAIRAALLAATGAYLVVTHARTAPVVLVTVLWIVVVARRRWRVSLAGVAAAAAVAVPGFLAYNALVPQMYSAASNREERGLTRLLQLDPLGALTAFVGQSWYVFAAWYAVGLLGLVVVVALAIGEWRGRRGPRIGPATWGLAAFAGVLAFSVIWVATPIARDDPRFDLYAYGRYLDVALAVLAMVGIAAAVRSARRATALAFGAAALGITALFLLVVRPQVPREGWWGPNSVPGLIQWSWPNIHGASEPPWIVASLAGLAAVLLIALSWLLLPARRRAAVVASGMLLVMLASGIAAEVRTIRPSFDPWYTSFTLRHDVERTLEAHPDASLSFDRRNLSDTLGGVDTVSRNAYQFFLSPRALPVFDSDDEAPESELVISRGDWPLGEELGARVVARDTGMFDNTLWVMPGDLQDELEAAGELE
ncbi:hypothetical protein [Homoserinibacter sp. YIM 151385]|uniref:hypothetical protein n=1 Tax=Homoserinibacter sp. YIM 151385 TaxID=2985506 RepID=UPI0022F09C88|nr:hypothetical protein [Homoserinibacter sp. YIM 151385]WBU37773.1 hypothetical protein OF852_12765 [Homoserinibacter sp. YIM 151385]